MTEHLLKNLKDSVKNISFKCKMDALSRGRFQFIKLNGRDQGKVHGRNTGGFPDGSDSATIDDVLHTIGCDLFGGTRYKITIQVEEVPDARQTKVQKEDLRETNQEEGLGNDQQRMA